MQSYFWDDFNAVRGLAFRARKDDAFNQIALSEEKDEQEWKCGQNGGSHDRRPWLAWHLWVV
jgi:hypothetical protein